eukprot:2496352-Rhodomonas_salina.1
MTPTQIAVCIAKQQCDLRCTSILALAILRQSDKSGAAELRTLLHTAATDAGLRSAAISAISDAVFGGKATIFGDTVAFF